MTRGVSCMRSQRGAPLNIEEDLRVGDQMQILFCIEVVNNGNERAVDLKPVKFVKYCKYDPEEVKNLKVEEENLDAEIDQMAKEVDFEARIKYEESGVACPLLPLPHVVVGRVGAHVLEELLLERSDGRERRWVKKYGWEGRQVGGREERRGPRGKEATKNDLCSAPRWGCPTPPTRSR